MTKKNKKKTARDKQNKDKQNKVDVNYSKAFRKKRFWRKGHWVNYSIPYRIKQHYRNKRSTKEELEKRGGTRNDIRKKKKKVEGKKMRGKWLRFGKPRNNPAKKSLIRKELKEEQSKQTKFAEPRSHKTRRSIQKRETDNLIQTKLK